MRLLIAALFAPLLTVSARAQAPLPFDASEIRNFCAAVANPLAEPEPDYSWQRYRYEGFLARWAQVRPVDPVVDADRRIGRFLSANMARLVCNQGNFSPRNGNILKLAVSRQSNRFIHDVLERWRPDLNRIDATDGRTVLDYIRDRRTGVGPATTFGATLGRYYDRFRAAGARHASELRR